MKSLKIPALAVILTIAAAALADDAKQQEMQIVVAGALPEESATIRWIGSDDAGFDMQAMQIGESQSIVDESGRSVLITREAEGFRLDVDGKTIMVPDIGLHGEYLTLVDGADMTADFDVEIAGNHQVGEYQAVSAFAAPVFGNGGVTIISGEPLDASTQESIKAVLLSAGRDDEVTFIDHSGAMQDRQIKMISKQIEVVQ